jgi:hypothetical protein
MSKRPVRIGDFYIEGRKINHPIIGVKIIFGLMNVLFWTQFAKMTVLPIMFFPTNI